MRCNVAILFFVISLALSRTLIAQGYTNYTIKDGLPSNHIYRSTQDFNGFIWIITDRGISKFDGKKFKNFTTDNGLPTNDIWNIRITKDNRVWYFSKSDQLGYIQDDIVYSFPASDGAFMHPAHLRTHGTNVSFMGSNFEYSFNDSIWQRKDRPYGIFYLKEDVVLEKGGTDYFQIRKGNRILEESYFSYPDRASIRSLINDSIFGGVSDQASIIYDFKNERGIRIRQNEDPRFSFSLKKNRFHQVNQKIQFTGANFLAILDHDFKWSTIHTLPEELNSHFSFQDAQGSIWAATFDLGLYKISANYNTVKTTFKNKEIQLLKFIDDQLYVGIMNEGIYVIDTAEISQFDNFDSYANSILKFEDSLIVSYQNETLISHNNIKKRLSNRDFIRGKRFVNHKGILWSDGFSTIFRYFPNSFQHKTYDNNYNHLFSHGNDLFAFQNKQLVRYNENKDIFETFEAFKVGAKVTAIETYNDITYIGTEGDGMYVFKDKKLQKLLDGDRNFITAISEENKNSIWVIINGELQHYVVNDKDVIINHYPQINGFSTNNLMRLAIKDSILYLGSKNGLHEFDIASIKTTSNFELYVDAISLNGERLIEKSIRTPYANNQGISVSFGAINFNATKAEYSYRLIPNNEQWLTTETGEVNVSGLTPGKYSLELKISVNNEEKSTTIPILISPLWYQTLFFKIIASLLLLFGFGYLVYHLTRISETKKRKRLDQDKKLSQIQLRALRSQMNPHFVFNSLAAIQYFFNENEMDKGDDYLVKFSRLVRQFFELADKKEIKILEEKQLLTNYLNVEKLRFKDTFNYHINVPKELEQLTMPSMLLQPIVENSINHGIFNKETNGEVQVIFKKGMDDVLIVTIIDDGVGYDQTQKRKDLRLKSSQVLEDRLYYLNQSGDWEINVESGKAFPNRTDCGHQTMFTIKHKR